MKTFELTQEQINQLAEKKHAKELLQKFIPEAFETKLEVGKWHKSKERKNKTLFVPNKEQCDGNMGYGFNYLSEFKESNFNLCGSFPNNFELATEEEVSEALINEAKKRYTNKKVRCLDTNDIFEIDFNELRYYEDVNGLYAFDNDLETEIEIFKDGIWAEIIEEKNTFDKDYLDNKITEIYSLLGDIKQYVKQLENEN